MIVECTIEREGPTPVQLEKTAYMFRPLPDPKRKKGEPSTSVCEITDPEHLKFLFKSGQFREYKDGQEPVEKEKVINLSGYAIVKHQEGRIEGYRVETKDKTPKMYAGSDMTWKPNTTNLVPFSSEFEAWQWLKEEVAIGGAETLDTEAGKKDEPDFLKLAGRKK